MVETVYSASSWMKCCIGCYEVSCHPIIQRRWAVAGHKCATRSVVWRYRAAPLTPVVYLTVCLGTGKINKIWENSRNFFSAFQFRSQKICSQCISYQRPMGSRPSLSSMGCGPGIYWWSGRDGIFFLFWSATAEPLVLLTVPPASASSNSALYQRGFWWSFETRVLA